MFLLLVMVFFGCSREKNSLEKSFSQSSFDSLLAHISVSDKVVPQRKEDFLNQAYLYLNNISDDSLKNVATFKLAYLHLKEGDSLRFRKLNKNAFLLSSKLRDSSKIAESYWDMAAFMSDYHLSDSAFYYYNKAHKLYDKIGDDFYAARMLLNLAIIQKNIKDYTGSEITTINAINTLKPLNKSRQLYSCYNNLGIVFNELQEFDKALEYHEEAINYQKDIEGNHVYKETSLNNVGVIYQNLGDFNMAQKKFEEALENKNLYHLNTRLYAMILDNLAFSKLSQKDTLQVLPLLTRALTIRDSINHKDGIVVSKIHLAEYFLKKNEPISAREALLDAEALATETNNYRDLLRVSLLLAELDEDNSRNYLKKYIHLNDSLQKEERAIRNKFVRIRFETDEFIAQNEYLNKEKRFLYIGSVAAFGVVLLVFVNIHQRNRNKQLRLEQDQQNSNEEIYNLLLVQQNKLEEGRHREKNRISKELHDGVLGKLFGVRFMLESLYDKSDKDSVESKKKYIEDLRRIEEEVRSISHDLKSDYFSQKESFIEILGEYLENQKKAGKFDLKFENDANIEWDKLSSKTKINLFRIIQEAVNNINKHAEAKLVSLKFRKGRSNIEMIIEDNGRGFDIGRSSKGIGLKNMKSRVKSLRGHWNLSSEIHGTKIEVSVPLH